MVRREINGATVREMREMLGIGQPELAKRIGISQPHLSNIERGARPASPMVTRRIATELGVSLDSITVRVATEAAEVAS